MSKMVEWARRKEVREVREAREVRERASPVMGCAFVWILASSRNADIFKARSRNMHASPLTAF